GPQQVQISFEVDPSTLAGDGTHQGTVRIRANGNQKLTVRVQLEVRRPQTTLLGAVLRPVLVTALLALVIRWLLVPPADLFARLYGQGGFQAAFLERWTQTPGAEDGFLRSFVLATWWLGGLTGLVLVWKR